MDGYHCFCENCIKVFYFKLYFYPDHSGARNRLALLQYMFEGPEIQVQVKPHGNSKGLTPYFRTSDSAKEQIEMIAATQPPKAAIATLTAEQGGR